jgi:alkylated DNA nucleotide flippase Atl1
MRQCPNPEIPCHRVIQSDGSVGGYGYEGVRRKMLLLRGEEIPIKKGKIDLSRYEFKRFHLSGFGPVC